MYAAVNNTAFSITDRTTPLKFYGVADRWNDVTNHWRLLAGFLNEIGKEAYFLSPQPQILGQLHEWGKIYANFSSPISNGFLGGKKS